MAFFKWDSNAYWPSSTVPTNDHVKIWSFNAIQPSNKAKPQSGKVLKMHLLPWPGHLTYILLSCFPRKRGLWVAFLHLHTGTVKGSSHHDIFFWLKHSKDLKRFSRVLKIIIFDRSQSLTDIYVTYMSVGRDGYSFQKNFE